MARVGVIGGTGAELFGLHDAAVRPAGAKPFGAASADLRCWDESGHQVLFMARHGVEHRIPPHEVNYRANIELLRAAEVDYVLGFNAVGGITPRMYPGRIVFPHQYIDYSWGRQHSFESAAGESVQHIDCTQPFSTVLRQRAVQAAQRLGYQYAAAGVYAVTQGPRLETPAEIDRMERDGCDVVGMTLLPEASLALEAGLEYASCALVVNYAAGRGTTDIHAEIGDYISRGVAELKKLLSELLAGPL